MKKIFLSFILLISICILSGCVHINLSDFDLNNSLKIVSRQLKPLRVSGNSMEPAIPANSLIFYSDAPFENLAANDIIIFKYNNNSPIKLSRIVNIENGQYKIKPDNRSEPAIILTKENYLGKVENNK